MSALGRCPQPFPMTALSVTDADFAKRYAQTSLEEYRLFKAEMLV